jgi:hypothetical protein
MKYALVLFSFLWIVTWEEQSPEYSGRVLYNDAGPFKTKEDAVEFINENEPGKNKCSYRLFEEIKIPIENCNSL